ncbi:MAG: beta-N-acetylhexosaminidase [Clostridia bacterium]|nr:beta-N-acetylhexosaminidase [Clostridia bacterium]
MNYKFIASDELIYIAKELAHITSVTPDDAATATVTVIKGEEGLNLKKDGGNVTLTYGEKRDYCRALGLIGQFMAGKEAELTQKASFNSLGYMPDCSRNAVLSVAGAKELMRHMAAMGFNAMMLYTEDTYEIPEYKYFGHMRGRYSVAEMKELDAYALSIGIELIPCIQVLAHLDAIFRWSTFGQINDIDNILNIADERSYELIDAMLKVCSECFTSKRINLGMDEAHNLGRGKYFDKTKEHVHVTDLMKKHLTKVTEMAQGYGYTPMMWSDMFFRPFFPGYYTTEGTLPEESLKSKPEGIVPIYWDYYCGEETVDNMMKCHEQFGCEYAFAGGAWKWIGFAPNNAYSLKLSDGHLRMCKKHKVSTVFTTGWGDRGGEAAQLSILPALLQYAEYCYNDKVDTEHLNARSEALFGLSLDAFLHLDLPNIASYNKLDEPTITTQCKYLLFNAPLGGLMDKHVAEDDPETYASHAETLLAYADHERYGYMFRNLGLLCHVLEVKSTLSLDIRKAYEAKDMDTLLDIANERIPEILIRLDEFEDAFRGQWYRENKTFGFDVQELYFGGLKEQLRCASLRINNYAEGIIEHIEEVEQPALDFYCHDGDRGQWKHLDAFSWNTVVSANRIV